MVQFHLFVVVALLLSLFAVAHPGQSNSEKQAEAQFRRRYLDSLKHTDLAHCADKLTAQGVAKRASVRRRETLINLRQQAGINHNRLNKRQEYAWDEVLAKDHHSKLNLASSWQTANWDLLGDNQTVMLHPEVELGPFWVTGEDIRKDVREKEPGVTLHLDFQVINIKTCSPITGSAVEIWGCNSTGVYSGVVDGIPSGQAANIQNKALRGIQITDKDGSVRFDTIFPGHYKGRTNHLHVITHRDQTILANKTIAGGAINHVGQLFFDQSLIDEVTKISPYSDNKNEHWPNVLDGDMYVGTKGMADPVFNYVLLGNKLQDGIFAWLNFGISVDATENPVPAFDCGKDGCKEVD
ncbi:aromatic compound dioxygenase [Microthyrium microscopicum]|uniref:Aromatic compound dioxygenase n=1 Tax=Microthyrium microscopicum TaxID=703497 RepID=A0A6A6UL82_9PEZI|nr:aromatic compound dioxygenase [Microthyrium microscopicum]